MNRAVRSKNLYLRATITKGDRSFVRSKSKICIRLNDRFCCEITLLGNLIFIGSVHLKY